MGHISHSRGLSLHAILFTQRRAGPDNIPVQSKVPSVCPRITSPAGLVRKKELNEAASDLGEFVAVN